MTTKRIALASALLLASGCTGAFNGQDEAPLAGSDAGTSTTTLPTSLDGGGGPDAPQPNWDAFFAKDPPPKYCGPDLGVPPPPLPGGTPDCPDDKNREGCPCTKEGETAACWPGLRVNRNRGVCKDGVTTCRFENEVQLRWGPCKGYVLPTPGVTKGAGACTCFSQGQWSLQNLSPCFVTYPNNAVYAVSTFVNASGNAECPPFSSATPPPQPKAGVPWSTNTLTVDCAGKFTLCFTIKAGDAQNPSANDCELAKTCVTDWYAKANTAQTLPPLPSWTSNDAACADKFVKSGGYGEMSVVGESVECQLIDDNGQPLVFNRVTYCPLACAQNPSLPGCQSCGMGGSGSF